MLFDLDLCFLFFGAFVCFIFFGEGESFGKETPKSSETEAKMANQLEKDAGFMDKYSRQIGAFGLETMAKVRCSLCAFECGVACCVKCLGSSTRLAF